MNSKGQETSSREPYRVGFPHNRPVNLTPSEFPLLDRVLGLSEKIQRVAGRQGWMTVLNAVRESEAAGQGFNSLPEKVRQLILEAETDR